MKRITMICIAGLVAAGSQAIADDSPTMTPTQGQSSQSQSTMKDCMDKQKATNSSMTQSAMETVCKNEAKRQKDKNGNDLATAPQGTPQN